MAAAEKAKRPEIMERWGALKTERSTWWAHWSDLSRFLLPRSGRFFVSDRNRGEPRHNNINDSTGTRALRILAAGMMSGMTSPARPWFRLSVGDPMLAKQLPVKRWLNDVTLLMRDVFARSNTYRALHQIYEELGAFGTAASIVLPSESKVIHHEPLTIGTYAISEGPLGTVDTLYRQFQMPVHKLVGTFGIDQVSPTTKAAYDRGQLEQWMDVVHAIEPNYDRDPKMVDSRNMAWRSVYFEPAAPEGLLLRDSGFPNFPAVVPRWQVSGGDIYGNSPGMEALGDVKQLMHEQLRKGQAIDYMVRPPLVLPTAMRGQDAQTLPGGIMYLDGASAIKTGFDVNLKIDDLLMDIQEVHGRINGSFYADLFLMLANRVDTTKTATEVAELHEEKLLMLGPVLERLQNEMLDPLIEHTFWIMVQRGMLPPPPPELGRVPLNIEYVSMLAQAQQAVGVNSIDRFIGGMTNLAQIRPDVVDNLDADRWAATYSEILGVDPGLVVDPKLVAQTRQARAQAQAQAQANEAKPAAAQAVKNLSQVDPQGLKDVMSQFSGYTTPQGA